MCEDRCQSRRSEPSDYTENICILDSFEEYDKPTEVIIDEEKKVCSVTGSQQNTSKIFEHQEKPYIKIREFNSLTANTLEEQGILTDRYIEVGSYCLDKAALPGKFAIAKCNLSEMELNNIDIISYHQFLQYLDLSRNKLTTLSPLSSLQFLKYLDASHNLLTKLLDFKAPIYLLSVNCSHNLIDEMVDLTDFWSLSYLYLSNNSITYIQGLQKLKYLRHLDLSFNKIEVLENICHLQLRELYLDHNNISEFETNGNALSTNVMLTTISISYNMLTTLKVFENMRKVENINVSHNLINELTDLNYLRDMIHLQVLSLHDNLVCKNAKYRQQCLYLAPKVIIFDEEPVDVIEKGNVEYLFAEKFEKEAQQHNINNEILMSFTTPNINSTIIPEGDKVAQIIILVGPIASNKNKLIHKLAEHFPKFAKTGISYTTRPRLKYEVEGKDYHFISEAKFRELTLDGRILSYSRKYGNSYGIDYNELTKISEQVGLLILQMDIISGMQIRAKLLNCKLIVAISSNEKNYIRDLIHKFYCSPWISEHIEAYILNDKNEVHNKSERVFLLQDDDTLNKLEEYSKIYKKSEDTASQSHSIRSSIYFPKFKIDDVFNLDEFNAKSNSAIPMSILRDSSKSSGKGHQGSQVVFATESESVREVDDHTEEGEEEEEEEADLINKFLLNAISMYNVTKKKELTEHNESSLEYDQTARSASQTIHQTMHSSYNASSISFGDTSGGRETYKKPTYDSVNNDSSSAASQRHVSTCDEFLLAQASEVLLKYSEDEKSAKSLEYFVKLQCKRRKMYIEMYCENPGIFLTMIHTDEEYALEKLLDVVKQCVNRQNNYATEIKKPHCKTVLNPDMQKNTLNLLKTFMK